MLLLWVLSLRFLIDIVLCPEVRPILATCCGGKRPEWGVGWGAHPGFQSDRCAVGPRLCMGDNLPSDSEVAGLGETPGESRAQKMPPPLPLRAPATKTEVEDPGARP